MHGIISLRSTITRRKANKTAECPYKHSANTDRIFFCPSCHIQICEFVLLFDDAEVEFDSEQEAADFQPPEWFDEDVTLNRKYHNSNLSQGLF